MGHGRTIINIDNHEVQTDIYQKIVSQNLSVRETEVLVKKYQESLLPEAKKVKNNATAFAIADEQQNAITSFFGTKVALKVASNGKGSISIPFQSEEEFKRILKLISV